MKRLLFLPILVMLAGVGCKSDSKAKTTNGASATGTTNVGTDEYSIDKPTGWTTQDTTVNGMHVFYLMAPKLADGFTTNINVITESMSGMSFEDYTAASAEKLTTFLKSSKALDKGDIEADGLKGNWVIFTMEQSNIKMKAINYAFPKNGTAYVITGTSKVDDFDKYRGTFDEAAKSFKVK